MLRGAAFYRLEKLEPRIQDYKLIAIKDKTNGHVYHGQAARQLLGLPTVGNARVAPGDHGHYDIYIQSTSVNRKLKFGSTVMYWPKVGVEYQEGISSRFGPL